MIYKNNEFIFLTFILIIGLSIYSLIMSNEGTFVRYRFTLYYPFLLGVFYISQNRNKKKILKKSKIFNNQSCKKFFMQKYFFADFCILTINI